MVILPICKLIVASGLLLLQAACTTAPQPASAPLATTNGAPDPTQTELLPANSGFSGLRLRAPADGPAVDSAGLTTPKATIRATLEPDIKFDSEPTIEPPRSALLAGGSAREYQRGGASWYGPGFHGRRTASGERYDMNAFTAAHRTLPFGTWVRVRSLVNGREVDVRITDRGPFIRSRVVDLSRAAAVALGMLGLGFKEVVLSVPESAPVGAGLGVGMAAPVPVGK